METPTARRSTFWRVFLLSLGIQLAVYAVYVLMAIFGWVPWFGDAYLHVYCWFSRRAILEFADVAISDRWARIGFFTLVGPTIGIFLYSLVLAVVAKLLAVRRGQS